VKRARRRKIHVVTMGCPKNIVDSEKLMAQLRQNGAELLPTLDGAEIAVINTCGFIDAAKEESQVQADIYKVLGDYLDESK